MSGWRKRTIMELARESHMDVYGLGKDHDKFVVVLEAFAKLVREDERELCAQMCESYTDKSDSDHEAHGYACAIAIRARGQA